MLAPTTNDTTLAQQMVAAAPAARRNMKLSTAPQQMTVVKVWSAMFRSIRKYGGSAGFVGIHNMPRIVGSTLKC